MTMEMSLWQGNARLVMDDDGNEFMARQCEVRDG
jgi:hypothetical protein